MKTAAIFNLRTQPIPAPDPDLVGAGVMVVDPLRQMPIFERFRPFLPPVFRDCPCATAALERGDVATVLNIVQLPERPKGSSPVAIIALEHRGPVAAIETSGLQTVFTAGASVALKAAPSAEIGDTRDELLRSAQQHQQGLRVVQLEVLLGPQQEDLPTNAALPFSARILDRIDALLTSQRNPVQNLLPSGWIVEVRDSADNCVNVVAHSADLLPLASLQVQESPKQSKRHRVEEEADQGRSNDEFTAFGTDQASATMGSHQVNVGSELRSILAARRRKAESESSDESPPEPLGLGQKRRRAEEEGDGRNDESEVEANQNPLELGSSGSDSRNDDAGGDAESESVQSVAGSAPVEDDALYAPVSYDEVAPMLPGHEYQGEAEGDLEEPPVRRSRLRQDPERVEEEMSPLMRKANEHRAPSEVSDTIHSLDGEILLREERARASSALADSGIDEEAGDEDKEEEAEEEASHDEMEGDFYEDTTVGVAQAHFTLELPIQTGLGGAVTRTVVVDSSVPAPESLIVPTRLPADPQCPVRLGFGSQRFMEVYGGLHVLNNEAAALALIGHLERLSSASERCILEDERPLPAIPVQLDQPSKGPYDILPFIIPSLQRWTPPAETDRESASEGYRRLQVGEGEEASVSPAEGDDVRAQYANMEVVPEGDDAPEVGVEAEVLEDV